MPSGLTRYLSGQNTGTATASGINGLTQGRFVGVTVSGAPLSGTFSLADYVIDQSGQMYVCTTAGAPGTWVTPTDTKNLLVIGEESMDRRFVTSQATTSASGNLSLTYFTARKTETTTQVRVMTGSTAAAATPTICRIGLYAIAANGDGTLVASTPNDTSLFAATSTAYTRSWSVSFAKVAGARYAIGIIVVSGVATPTFIGAVNISTNIGVENGVAPRVHGRMVSQSDLPSTFTEAALLAGAVLHYAAILP